MFNFIQGAAQKATAFLNQKIDYGKLLDEACSKEDLERLFNYLYRVSAHSSLIRSNYLLDVRRAPIQSFRFLMVPNWLTDEQRKILEGIFEGAIVVENDRSEILAVEELHGVPVHALQHFYTTLPQAIGEKEDLSPFYIDSVSPVRSYLPDACVLSHLPIDHLVAIALITGTLEWIKEGGKGKGMLVLDPGKKQTKIVLGKGLIDDVIFRIQNKDRLVLLEIIKKHMKQSKYCSEILETTFNSHILTSEHLQHIHSLFFEHTAYKIDSTGLLEQFKSRLMGKFVKG